jgi:hypothetical protein
VRKTGAHYILDHTRNGDGLKTLAKINGAAGHAALRAHARLQADRDDLDAEVRAAMVDDEDGTRIVTGNPPWSAFSNFTWERHTRTDKLGQVIYSTTELLRGTVRHADVKRPKSASACWLPRPNRPLPRAGMHVRTCDSAGTAQDHYVLRCQHGEDQVWLQREFVLVPNELKQVQAEHDGDMPDEQAVFAVMCPQFIYLINTPLHVCVGVSPRPHVPAARADRSSANERR